MLPGGMCTMQLADMGADVLKIEPPVVGDAARGGTGAPNGFFLLTNRNKRSLTLNLKHPEAREILLALAAEADVFVEGARPGAMSRLGLDYAVLRGVNPKVVYCSITGYGQDGPLYLKAGHDINYQGYSGALGQAVTDGGRPSPGNVQIADLAGGALMSALGIVTALYDAQRSGEGRYIDVSMTDCAMALNVSAMAGKYMLNGSTPEPGRDVLSGGVPCYRTYETADGRHLAFGAVEAKFWVAFCKAAGRPDLVARGWDMGEGFAAAVAEIAALAASRSLADWTALLEEVDACVTPVLTLDEALVHPHTEARAMTVEVEAGGSLATQFAFPLQMSDYAFEVSRLPPKLGQHGSEVLNGLGYSDEEIGRLRESGAI